MKRTAQFVLAMVFLLQACFASAAEAEGNGNAVLQTEKALPEEHAEEQPIKQPIGTVVLYFENDLFYNTDKYYTNAVQIRAISPPLRRLADNEIFPDALDEMMDGLEKMQQSGTMQYNISFGMGQAMFTPKDTGSRELQKDDRPYAGYLYGFLALHAKQASQMDTFELALGVVGPSARAKSTQNEVHRIRGLDLVYGWQHQLRDEPAGTITWSRNYRLNTAPTMNTWSWNVLPYHSVSAGNVLTQAAAGFEARYGWNVPSTFGTSLIRPGSSVDAPTPRTAESLKREHWGWYVFAGAEGRAIARNIFLDGNTWKDSHSVSKKPFVAELNAGLAITYKDIRLAYNHVYLTKEFKGQPKGQHYGSMTLTIPF